MIRNHTASISGAPYKPRTLIHKPVVLIKGHAVTGVPSLNKRLLFLSRRALTLAFAQPLQLNDGDRRGRRYRRPGLDPGGLV